MVSNLITSPIDNPCEVFVIVAGLPTLIVQVFPILLKCGVPVPAAVVSTAEPLIAVLNWKSFAVSPVDNT